LPHAPLEQSLRSAAAHRGLRPRKPDNCALSLPPCPWQPIPILLGSTPVAHPASRAQPEKSSLPFHTGGSFQLVKKHACGGFFDEYCTICLRAYGSPGASVEKHPNPTGRRKPFPLPIRLSRLDIPIVE
ncbi:MAG: hypothetical protein J6A48_06325, partial [Clostridia bacterium]|nr:hypothetical protein [Clostridia bacterium]